MMADEGAPPDVPSDPPKKKGLDISQFLGPTADVQTSIGKVHLYPLLVSDVSRLDKLVADTPPARLREFLPRIASLSVTTNVQEERVPLATDLIATLSEADLEMIAEAYASSTALQKARLGLADRSALPREGGEPATAYLDRLLKKEVRDQVESVQQMRKQILASTGSIFDQVRKSSSVLGTTVSDFELLSRTVPEPAIDTKHFEFSNHMAEHQARLARERAEELEMVRLTGKMTAQSATTLRDLAEAATVLLERLDERDRRANLDTRKQLRIAVGSVLVSAVLALGALIYAALSFQQDKANNAAGDKWQASVLSAINERNGDRKALEQENRMLLAKLDELARAVQSMGVAVKRPAPAAPGTRSGGNQAPVPGSK